MVSRWIVALLAAGPVLAGTAPPKPVEKEEALPPALGAHALADELAQAAVKRAGEIKQISAERQAAQVEKAALEKLRAEIEQARASLKEETARLQKLVDRGGARDKSGARALEEPSGPQLEVLAKMLKSMKAEQAAPVVKSLSRPLAVALLRRLKPADAGALLEKLETPLATELIVGLSEPREVHP